ncbi:MAG: hypothetical protein HYR88_12870 [Verrucomicrobia bacterium]|nr:hypothetical protein [Verrucomicrobiota bacterium]MBI3867615.1 hypothetical protein [Verrucomicrobiota bacterium]
MHAGPQFHWKLRSMAVHIHHKDLSDRIIAGVHLELLSRQYDLKSLDGSQSDLPLGRLA